MIKRVAIGVGILTLLGGSFFGYLQLAASSEPIAWPTAASGLSGAPSTTVDKAALTKLPGVAETVSKAEAETTVATTAAPAATKNAPTVTAPTNVRTGPPPTVVSAPLPTTPAPVGYSVVEMSAQVKAEYIAILQANPDSWTIESYDPKFIAYDGVVVGEAVSYTINAQIAAIPGFAGLFVDAVEAEVTPSTTTQSTVAGKSVWIVTSSATGETTVVWVNGNQALTVYAADQLTAVGAAGFVLAAN